MHNILSTILETAVKEWAKKAIDIEFIQEFNQTDFSSKHRLYVNGVMTEWYIRSSVAYDIEHGKRMTSKRMSGEELYHEVSEIISNAIEHEVLSD